MKRMICGLLMICMMLSSAFADNYTDMMEKAEEYYFNGDADHAIVSYHLAQEIDPSRADAFYGEALILFSQGEYVKAKELSKKAIQADPIFPEAWSLICRIDATQNDVDAFDTDLLYAEVVDADIVSFAGDIAVMYSQKGMYEKAHRFFDYVNVEQLSEEQKILYKRTLIAIGNWEEAENLGFIKAGIRNTKLDKAFDNDNLILKKVEMPKIDVNNFEISDDLWEVSDTEKPEDFNTELEKYFATYEPQLISIAPTGNSGIYRLTGTGIGYYNGKYHIIYPSQKRGVTDEYGNLAKYIQEFQFQDNQMLGEEGVLYSPDGRYAAIYNVQVTLEKYQYFVDPIIIDLSTGEMILTATYDNNLSAESFGTTMTACFSSDNRYFYYILYGNTTEDRCALYRYDLNSNITEFCCSIPYNAYYPFLSEIADGSMIIVEDQIGYDNKKSVLQIRQIDGRWEIERNEFSIDTPYWFVDRLLYSQNSGIAFAAGAIRTFKAREMFVTFIPDAEYRGLNVYHAINKEDNKIVDISQEEYISANRGAVDVGSSEINPTKIPFEIITKALLSPDGYYAMLLTREDTNAAHLYLVELETLELREVKGLDATKISIDTIAGKYKPIIEWNYDTLIIYYGEEILTYQFDYE